MAYQALYRTYRPRDFEEVAGQEHITKTFKNALINNKLSHAYLFSGPRGTGKTSIAKIIAKAVNCMHAPIANPCNECDHCIGIDKNTINDVIEIDAASNNGVDEIREIRDKVKYLPGTGKYKVYIIDEVHMLSTGAFNALLKTLEEPPKHVIFILATTEPHKIPATIHSRCQRFDFRGIGMEEMLEKLKEIVLKESLDVEDEALHLIAETAEGGMRDAISLLDQVVSYSEDKISIDDVHAIKGSISDNDIIEIANALEANDVVKAVANLDQLISQGKEAHKLVDDFVRFYRDILMVKNTQVVRSERILYSNDMFNDLASKLSNERVFYYIDILHDTQLKIRYSGNAKLYLELAFVKMVDELQKQQMVNIEKVRKLEQDVQHIKDKLEEAIDLIEERPLSSQQTEDDFDKPDFFKDSEEELTKQEPEEITPSQNLEKSTEKKTEEVKPSTTQEEPLEEHQKHYQRFSKKHYKTFDIAYVEDVLNTANREIKIDMVKKWYDIERKTEGRDLEYAKMITKGNLVATNGTMIIVAYDSYPMCNHVMKPSVKAHLIEVLEDYYGRKMMFMALPEDLWEVISKEFITKYRSRDNEDEFIQLTPINHPRLIEKHEEKEDYQDVESDSLKEAKDLFGDIVKVKKQGDR